MLRGKLYGTEQQPDLGQLLEGGLRKLLRRGCRTGGAPGQRDRLSQSGDRRTAFRAHGCATRRHTHRPV